MLCNLPKSNNLCFISWSTSFARKLENSQSGVSRFLNEQPVARPTGNQPVLRMRSTSLPKECIEAALFEFFEINVNPL